jgi:replication fork clamp-binding protein CrfC
MILFLERIHPDNLISRVRESNMTAADLQVALLKDIRNEYSHNLSQQLYVSEDAWVLTQNAKEEMIKLINLCYGQVKPDDSAMELTRIIINTLMQSDKSPTEPAIRYIKQEIGTLF